MENNITCKLQTGLHFGLKEEVMPSDLFHCDCNNYRKTRMSSTEFFFHSYITQSS